MRQTNFATPKVGDTVHVHEVGRSATDTLMSWDRVGIITSTERVWANRHANGTVEIRNATTGQLDYCDIDDLDFVTPRTWQLS